ncbi:MAG TPA: winged helix-turn-helix domain-containing protein [Acidimicrobiales bacterium]|nr:winged helix-turn-helix domain-containing protein [Acidimicrobiales bacterium]
MFDTQAASDPVAVTLSWTASRGIDIRTWPEDGRPTSNDHPVLYLVPVDVEPPRCTLLDDWIRVPLDIEELRARSDRLLARAAAQGATLIRVDDDGVLHVGDAVVILSEQESRLMRALAEKRGQLVLREDLHRAIWTDGEPNDARALDNRIKTLRHRIKGLPIKVHTIRGWGLLLDTTPA